MAEFKKLSDVEVVEKPTESANVLIEENGVIKKAPKTAVGGGGVHTVLIDGLNENKITVTDGIYEALEAFLDGVYTDVRVMWRENVDGKSTRIFPVNFISRYPGDDYISISCEYGLSVYIYKNGEHSYYYD